MKKIIILVLIFVLSNQCTYSEEYDDSIDTDLRKQYKVNELPALPKVSPSPVKTTTVKTVPDKIINTKMSGKTLTIKSGTKIILISQNPVSNWSSEGSKISFVSQNNIVTKEGEVIPAGCIFKGTVINSHSPQITGNGGLIQLKINEIYYNGIVSYIDTKLTQANSKRIIMNNIKGKRKYWRNCKKALTPGEKTFKAMKNVAGVFTPIPIINILSIIPYTLGGTVYITNAAVAPVISVFMKGGAITLPAGTPFSITILGNNQIRG